MNVPDGDEMPSHEEPKIFRFGDKGESENGIQAAFFGLERYATLEHQHDAGAHQTYLVDRVHARIMIFDGNPQTASTAFGSLLKGPAQDVFYRLERMPYYGFLISITQSPARLWVASRTGGGGPYAWARDGKNGLLWEGDEGVLKIHVDGTSEPISVRTDDFVTAVFPDEKDGTAWIYLSHQKGELQHIDRTGKVLRILPLVKFQGSKIPMVFDFRRKMLWYVDTGYQNRLVKLSLDGVRQLELTTMQFAGVGRVCWDPSLALQEVEGSIWVHCGASGIHKAQIYKLDGTGKRLMEITPDFER
jgi:hypothetical protein